MEPSAENTGLRSPPCSFFTSLRFLGPGLILSAAIVGSGELIMTTTLGAKAGFALLWVVLLGCLVKVAVQLEYGRHCIVHGRPTIQAWNASPGPRLFGLQWTVYMGLFYLLTSLVGLGGVVGGAAQAAAYAFPQLNDKHWAVVLGISLALLTFHGYYRPIETIAIVLNTCFMAAIIYCAFAVMGTPYAFGWGAVADGFTFRIPGGALPLAVSAFAITGVAAGEIFLYPYWCLEKGYGRWTGPREDSEAWAARARGWIRVMHVDAFVSMAIYTFATVCFYLLGASVLAAQDEIKDGSELILQISKILTEVLGSRAMVFFMFGAFAVLYSTAFANCAGFARIWTDFFHVCHRLDADNPVHRRRAIAVMSCIVPGAWTITYLVFQKPQMLIIILGTINALFLLVVAWQALVFRYRESDARLRPSLVFDAALWVSIAAIAVMAGFTAYSAWQNARAANPAPPAPAETITEASSPIAWTSLALESIYLRKTQKSLVEKNACAF